MSFGQVAGCLPGRQRRLNRAQWWFQRMRQIVDHAIDWPPTPPPRPEQIWLPGASHSAGLRAQPKPPIARDSDERQVVE